jgi:hypothetical protein
MLLFGYDVDNDENWRAYMAKNAAHFRDFYDTMVSILQKDSVLRGAFIHPVSLISMMPLLEGSFIKAEKDTL